METSPAMRAVPFDNVTSSAINIVCYAPTMITTNGIWQGANPLDYSLPLYILQVTLVTIVTRAVVILLRPLGQPRVIAEILAGILLGPSVMGRVKEFGNIVFPEKSLLTLETTAYLGLLFFLFLVGVEMDVMVIKKTGRRALSIAAVGMVFPFLVGTGAAFLFHRHTAARLHEASYLLFVGFSLSITAFPVLARILAEIKLLNSEIGRLAMSAAVVNDMCAWILLAISIAVGGNKDTVQNSIYILLSGTAFVLFCFYAARPAMWWVVRRIPEGENVEEVYVCAILTGVMVAGLCTDAIGIHAVFGAFVFGLAVPNGPLGVTLIERLEDFVTGLLLPLFFIISGLRTNVSEIKNPVTAGILVLVFVLASFGKILGTLLVSVFYSIPLRDGLSLGFLMNTKGLIEMIVLNIGRDKNVLDDESFAVMVLTSLVMTSLVTPVVTSLHRPSRRLIGYKRRNLQRAKPDTELRILTCLHNTRNVPSIISLLEISNPTKRSPIFVYALHLTELTGRASAMLVVHNSSAKAGTSNVQGGQAQTEHIVAAFESYEQHAAGVSVQPLTAISPYPTMHDDICGIAEDKHVSIILLPFHKQQTVDGGMETTNPALRLVNQNVLATAPCSVAILVDRGLSGTAHVAGGQLFSHHIVLLFFGGPDDREALAYAMRMVEHPGISLTIIRFIPGEEAALTPAVDSRVITIVSDSDRERQLDEDFLNEFRIKNVGNERVAYIEKVVDNSEDTVAAIRSMENAHDLYIVGRGHGDGTASALLAGMTEWTECPELGPIGDLLASPDFGIMASVLVVQQYVGSGVAARSGGEGGAAVENPRQYLNNAKQRDRVVAGNIEWSRR